MLPAIIGIVSGVLAIILIRFVKTLNNHTTYGLVLTGIGFLYVGFTWSHLESFIINAVQAIAFLLLANWGIRKNENYLVAGFFLHGGWDLIYPLIAKATLIPPHYDIFCLSIDFTMGFYLLYDLAKRRRSLRQPVDNNVIATRGSSAFDSDHPLAVVQHH
jgi:hypothetical protein